MGQVCTGTSESVLLNQYLVRSTFPPSGIFDVNGFDLNLDCPVMFKTFVRFILSSNKIKFGFIVALIANPKRQHCRDNGKKCSTFNVFEKNVSLVTHLKEL